MQSTDTIKAPATPEEILHPGSRALFRYWEAVRGEMSAPPRDWLDLQKIRSLVPFLFMIERTPSRGYAWRLAGTKVCELWGMELTGMPALAQGDRFERETVARLLDSVVDEHQPFVLRFRLNSAKGMTVAAELVGTPLRARNNGATYVFGVVMPFREANWPRHDQVTTFELSAARSIWTEPVPGARDITPGPSIRANLPQAFQIINGGRSGN
ncbi:PAS domain-containing protein [Nordella sp. HKS 07]|uniref:PAS domain-containing protein n=1 Tax=Nordella sp. HKS 07 TaxID=2712222 RepID=UPI002110A084|nr:PAS domain-containing protein [Nordella sp. HKS 07]